MAEATEQLRTLTQSNSLACDWKSLFQVGAQRIPVAKHMTLYHVSGGQISSLG